MPLNREGLMKQSLMAAVFLLGLNAQAAKITEVSTSDLKSSTLKSLAERADLLIQREDNPHVGWIC